MEFLISTNPGEPLLPMIRIASGGELSRIMLAIKSVLSGADGVPTVIFDEVDTGVSGRAAQKVAEKLRAVSGTKQVLCVTHLPQIAAAANVHLLIQIMHIAVDLLVNLLIQLRLIIVLLAQ